MTRCNNIFLLASTFVLLLVLDVTEAGFRQGFKTNGEPLSKEDTRKTAHRLMQEEPQYDNGDMPVARETAVYRDTLDFVVIMEETAYSPMPSGNTVPIGTKFAFSGEITTSEDEMGRASGTCTVASEQDEDLTVCDVFLKFYFADGEGTVALTGHTDAIDGHFQVTGTGGILSDNNSGGGARIYFDPAGNPILYVLLQM
mmetsp:Transcript_5647/g.8478  ORF Transcript_5647/g.8478 Transcript_5647/m.8478 type:complete len:199 (-) Transcript_5647:133-729(-)|eukprot:CAMPEP_0117027408 /NCGR_PEP_ID=MMETSP0472-20121206/20040_1 /TAXON_ID=693140 ORGANISM="Tiarina fusus, Strain LIS" /NCGR_SAMPLE_ID=MMETSP0472 /ASSEMBLY_ACC=CAM_ASM_000603 /LENGTH=198 /DNA_ID=CAMNT_0004734651 /DNA_START=154 /DNA_END=750 /DNA_ORIENTATION=+